MAYYSKNYASMLGSALPQCGYKSNPFYIAQVHVPADLP